MQSIVAFLKAAGFETWFDKDNLLAGQDWRKVIEREIARARLLLVCISSHSVDKTGFVQKEMRLAGAGRTPTAFPSVHHAGEARQLLGTRGPCALACLRFREQKASLKLLEAIGSATGEGARAPLSDHESLTAAIRDYNRPVLAEQLSQTTLGQAAQELLKLIEEEQDPEQRGIVEIRKEIQPGYTHFFPRIQYGGAAISWKTRIFREGIAQLVSAAHLFPPEANPSTNTRTYEYRLANEG